MKLRHLILGFLLLLGILNSMAQLHHGKHNTNIALGINRKGSDSTLVSKANIGLIANTDSLQGVQIGGLSSIVRRESKGLNIGGLFSFTDGDVHGAQLCGAINSVSGNLSGFQFAFINNTTHSLNGFQLAGFSNISTAPFRGIQLSGITNTAMGVKEGMQISFIANICSSYMRGLQIGAYNYVDTLNGSQIGLINVCNSHPRGVQIGIINYSRDTIAHKIGLVNVNPKTKIDVMYYAGTSSKLNFAMRFRNRSTYSIVGVGTHYMGLDKRFSGALFYRIGQYFDIAPRWSVSSDIGFFHIETFQNKEDKPKRLGSLQLRVNTDYQINNYLSAFASIGYGDTRYYHHLNEYRNGAIVEAGIAVRYNKKKYPLMAGYEDKKIKTSTTENTDTDSIYAYNAPYRQGKHLWKGIAETTGINVAVHCFDRFVMNEDFAQVNLHTIHHNITHGFVWDNDQFSTNLFAHPYHGNLYYNSARSNGMSFWESAPFALGGSLMWETCGEIEPPAINDLMATTFGGICIGEVTHRISDIILNDSQRGFRRFLREFAATVVCPMKGFNRIISGDAWAVRNKYYKYHDYNRFPVDLSISVGDRYLADNGALFRGEHNPYVNLFMEYGNPFNDSENKPYDFFYAEATFGFSANQPLINGLHILGRIWGAPVYENNNIQAEFGIFQHFNYYDSKPVKDGTSLTPYRISEAASFGPGMIFSFPQVGALTRLEQRVFLSAILLGGTKSDYYNVIDRDYNMGSGFSIKTKTHMEFRDFGRFILHTEYYRIFTWKGYEDKDLTKVDPLYLNAQGDKGNASLLVINPIWELDLRGSLSAVLSGTYYVRDTYYKYHDNVYTKTYEIKLGLAYHF